MMQILPVKAEAKFVAIQAIGFTLHALDEDGGIWSLEGRHVDGVGGAVFTKCWQRVTELRVAETWVVEPETPA